MSIELLSPKVGMIVMTPCGLDNQLSELNCCALPWVTTSSIQPIKPIFKQFEVATFIKSEVFILNVLIKPQKQCEKKNEKGI